jgi:2-polyprenyl-6-methoxyphenol hydroxylase-like FAD-dependent oxidoreductase
VARCHPRLHRSARRDRHIAEYVPDKLVKGRVALVGDAAHVPTPMTGSGFSASLHDAETLAAAIAAHAPGPC